MQMGYDDSELIKALQSEDYNRVFEHLYPQAGRVERILRTKFNKCGYYVADEDLQSAVADALIQLALRGSTYDPTKATVITWWVSRGYYELCKLFRCRKVSLDKLSELGHELAQDTLAHQHEAEQPNPKIAGTLKLMIDRRAQVLRLHYLEDYPEDEVAQILGTSLQNVRVLLSRARHDFHNHWQ